MFLSLPVFQDPAPWNVVWRAGELFPIDVGDGSTLEERGGDWNTYAQKYIGSLNECYRMSLKWLCAVGSGDNLHGDEKYEACMNAHFGSGFCPSEKPFPCVAGCNRSYQVGLAHRRRLAACRRPLNCGLGCVPHQRSTWCCALL